MMDYWKKLFKKYSSKGILIDPNILLLWLVGMVNRDHIAKRKNVHTKKLVL